MVVRKAHGSEFFQSVGIDLWRAKDDSIRGWKGVGVPRVEVCKPGKGGGDGFDGRGEVCRVLSLCQEVVVWDGGDAHDVVHGGGRAGRDGEGGG